MRQITDRAGALVALGLLLVALAMAGVFGRNTVSPAEAASPGAEIPLVGGEIST